MLSQYKIWIQAGVVFLAFVAGFYVRDYMTDAQATKQLLAAEKEHRAEVEALLQDAITITKKNLELQDKITELDKTHTRTLNEQINENSRLRTDLAVSQRMRLQGTTCPKVGSSDSTSSTGVGDGASVELSPETRLLVWDLRESIIRDQAKLRYLQEERRTLTCDP